MVENLDAVDDRSVGCITMLPTVDRGLCVLMIKQRVSNSAQSNYWCFPKGHPEISEADTVAASRETQEETGVTPAIVNDGTIFSDVGYTFIGRLHKDRWSKHPDFPEKSKRPTVVTHKTVRYYLATCSLEISRAAQTGGTEEAEAVEWVPWGEVGSRICHNEEKHAYAALSTHPVALKLKNQSDELAISAAAFAIYSADALLVCSGAGLGVDSGLGSFRGKSAGSEPAVLAKRNLTYEDASDPVQFEDDPKFAWAYWKAKYDTYTGTCPHKGYTILKDYGAGLQHGMFSVTSNIDSQWGAVGVPDGRLWEVHGDITRLQCTNIDRCDKSGIWPVGTALDSLEVDPDSCILTTDSDMPRCHMCGALARPNILLFGDWGFESSRCDNAEKNYKNWKQMLIESNAKVAVLEIGAGSTIHTIRMEAQHAADTFATPLIRINPEEPAVLGLKCQGVGIELGALEALERISAAIQMMQQQKK